MSNPISAKIVLERRQTGSLMRDNAKQPVSGACKITESLQIAYGKVCLMREGMETAEVFSALEADTESEDAVGDF